MSFSVSLSTSPQAGLCSVDVGPPGELPDKYFPERLSLALEPECGAIYCHEMQKQRRIAPHCPRLPNASLPSSYAYLIADIGGGTADISAHKVSTSPLYVEELHRSVGNNCGGAKVNSQFKIFLQDLVDDQFFSKYISEKESPDKWVDNRFDLDELINTKFEEYKEAYGHLELKRKVTIGLPDSFMDVYGNVLKQSVEARDDENVQLVGKSLRISLDKMEEFFTPVIDEITSCISGLMDAVASQCSIDVIYLVGGFGGTPYVYRKFVEAFRERCEIIVPRSPEYAIVEGAVLYRRDPKFVRARKADATYGKSVIRTFKEGIHNPDKKFVVGGTEYCEDLFQTIVGVEDTVHPDHVYVTTSSPLQPEQSQMTIEVSVVFVFNARQRITAALSI